MTLPRVSEIPAVLDQDKSGQTFSQRASAKDLAIILGFKSDGLQKNQKYMEVFTSFDGLHKMLRQAVVCPPLGPEKLVPASSQYASINVYGKYCF